MMPRMKLNASFAAHMPRSGNLALISQSGAIAAGMVDWAGQNPSASPASFSIGDQIDVDIAICSTISRSTAIPARSCFTSRRCAMPASSCRGARCGPHQPIVVVKSGRMAQGARAAATHTGALAGADDVYDAAFRRAGMLRVFDLRELFDCAETLGRLKAPNGKRLAMLTNGGGLGVLAVDRLTELGGVTATLSPAAKQQLDAVLPPTWSGSNPVDIIGDADAARYAAALEVLLTDPDNDAVLVMNVQTAVASADDIADTGAARGCGAREAAASKAGAGGLGRGRPEISKTFDAAGIPNFATEDDAVRGFMHLSSIGSHRGLVGGTAEHACRFRARRRGGARNRHGCGRRGTALARSRRGQAAARCYQIEMVPTLEAADPEQAVAFAESLLAQGSKVVLKVLSRDITHKSDVGGVVVLNLATAGEVWAAAIDILARAKTLRPDARLSGVLVQPMVLRAKARELILGIAEDPTSPGGGVRARRHRGRDHQRQGAGAAPLDLSLARALIARTRVSRLLSAYRDVRR